MATNEYLSVPSQHYYSHNPFIKNDTNGAIMSDAPQSIPTRTMAIHCSRPRSVSLGSPLYDKTLRERQNQDLNAPSYAEFCNNVPPQLDLAKLHPRNRDTALATIVARLDNFLSSRNICRHFMIRLCSAPKCEHVHDSIFRDSFMAPLFGDAWQDLIIESRGNRSDKYSPRHDTSRRPQAQHSWGGISNGTNEDEFPSDLISFELSSTLDVAAGLHIPSSKPAPLENAGINTDMELEKSELQVKTYSEDLPHQGSSAECSLPPRPRRRRGRRFYVVRDRVSLWGKSAWKRSVTAKQKNVNESEILLAA